MVSGLLDKINGDEKFKHIKYIVIDTLNGLMVAEEMRILAMQSGDKRSAWSDLAQNGWAIVNKCLEMRENLTIIIICHSETISDENGIVRTRIKTNGRKLEKLVLESKMTTVIWAVRQDGKYKFILSADGSTCKVPIKKGGASMENIVAIIEIIYMTIIIIDYLKILIDWYIDYIANDNDLRRLLTKKMKCA